MGYKNICPYCTSGNNNRLLNAGTYDLSRIEVKIIDNKYTLGANKTTSNYNKIDCEKEWRNLVFTINTDSIYENIEITFNPIITSLSVGQYTLNKFVCGKSGQFNEFILT